jgi:endogenous inhibitor of DNA gyrase (YacG/DUF329 family)
MNTFMSQPKTKLCPHCKKPIKWEGNPFRPFCSERCRMIDLGKWAAEDYRIPGKRADEEEMEKGIRDAEPKKQ